MSAAASASDIAQLRHERREMRRELARVRWWRQLVQARRDLSIAGLAQPGTVDSVGIVASWEALAADAPTSRELSDAVWPQGDAPSVASLEELASLEKRLATYESRVAQNLDAVTTSMVAVMGAAQRTVGTAKERDHA